MSKNSTYSFVLYLHPEMRNYFLIRNIIQIIEAGTTAAIMSLTTVTIFRAVFFLQFQSINHKS